MLSDDANYHDGGQMSDDVELSDGVLLLLLMVLSNDDKHHLSGYEEP